MIQSGYLDHLDDSSTQLVEAAFLEVGRDELLKRRGLAMVGGADQSGSDLGRRGHRAGLPASLESHRRFYLSRPGMASRDVQLRGSRITASIAAAY